ncbi:MAG: glycosyltransferase family 4 protein [Acidimicrobiales bacterium]
MKLAVWTPLPPQRSGVADYSFRLVAQLARQAEIVVVVRDDTAPSARAPAGVAVVARSDYDPDAADLDVYHLGNQARFHAYMLEAIRRRPGILVLHDPALPDLHLDLCGGYGSTLFRQEARFDSPEAEVALPVRYVDGRVEVDWLRLPLARRVVEASALTIVHSAWIRDAFRARYPAARIVHRHHAAVVAAPEPERRVSEATVTFGAFGGVTPPKRTAHVIDAFAAVHEDFPGARLVVCGRSDEGGRFVAAMRARLADRGLDGAAQLRIDVPGDEMTRLIADCDAVIALRWPTLGETSGPMMEAFGIGRLVITSDVPQYEQIDGRFCWRVPVDEGEDAALAQRMRDVLAAPESARMAGDAARDFVRREASFELVASQYLELAEETIRALRR